MQSSSRRDSEAAPSIRSECTGDARLKICIATQSERHNIINIINAVAGERKYLQTDRYYPTLSWEKLFDQGINSDEGLLLLLARKEDKTIGFGRLNAEWEHRLGRLAGNVGIVLLPEYRSQGIGAIILSKLVLSAGVLNFQALTANILKTNIRSLNLFLKYGFNPVKTRNIYLHFLARWVEEIVVEKSL